MRCLHSMPQFSTKPVHRRSQLDNTLLVDALKDQDIMRDLTKAQVNIIVNEAEVVGYREGGSVYSVNCE